jgi:hypothetical protein
MALAAAGRAIKREPFGALAGRNGWGCNRTSGRDLPVWLAGQRPDRPPRAAYGINGNPVILGTQLPS